MDKRSWFKHYNILVLRQLDGNGLDLIHQTTKNIYHLNSEQADAFWSPWNADYIEMNNSNSTIQELLLDGFIVHEHTHPKTVLSNTIGNRLKKYST
jgi:hypothetical protein